MESVSGLFYMYVTKIKYILIYIHLERHQPYIYSNMALYGFKCVQGVSNLIHDGNEDKVEEVLKKWGGGFLCFDSQREHFYR